MLLESYVIVYGQLFNTLGLCSLYLHIERSRAAEKRLGYLGCDA